MFAFICTSHSSFTTSAFNVALLVRLSVCQQDLKTEQIPMKSGWQISLRQKNIWLDVGGYSDFLIFAFLFQASRVILPPRVLNGLLWQVDISESDLKKILKSKKVH